MNIASRRGGSGRNRPAALARTGAVAAGLILAVAVSACGSGTSAKTTGASAPKSSKSSMSGMSGMSGKGGMAGPKAGSMAPSGSFTTLAGQSMTFSPMSGHPTMLWLVTTWCPVCQVGTRTMASHLISGLASKHVKVIELMIHGDLGHSNPTLSSFMTKYAGSAYHNPDWMVGTASAALTHAYNPKGEMDIYYLVDSTGHVRYVNSGPAATASQILSHAAGLS